MTNENLQKLELAAKIESEENRKKDLYNRSCAPGEHRPTSIAAYLRYSAAVHKLANEIEYV